MLSNTKNDKMVIKKNNSKYKSLQKAIYTKRATKIEMVGQEHREKCYDILLSELSKTSFKNPEKLAKRLEKIINNTMVLTINSYVPPMNTEKRKLSWDNINVCREYNIHFRKIYSNLFLTPNRNFLINCIKSKEINVQDILTKSLIEPESVSEKEDCSYELLQKYNRSTSMNNEGGNMDVCISCCKQQISDLYPNNNDNYRKIHCLNEENCKYIRHETKFIRDPFVSIHKTSGGLFKCGKCKSTDTSNRQAQTRSADEPMTVFVHCQNCGNRWKC